MTLPNPNDKKKTILIVTERFYPEEFRINDLALAWIKKGYKVKVLTQVPSYPYGKVFKNYKNLLFQTELWNGIKIHRMITITGYKNSLFKKILHYANYVIFGSIISFFIGKDIDSVFIYHLGPLTDSLPAIIIKKIFHKRTTIWTLDIWPDAIFAFGIKRTAFREKVLNHFIKFVYKNCDNILVSSQNFTSKLKLYTGNKPIFYIPQWADEVNSKSSSQSNNIFFSKEKLFHFTFAGNIGKVQNLDNVIKAFALTKAKKNIQFNLIGDGWNLVNIKKLVNDNHYKNIVFWGRKPSSEMHIYYELSDVLVISLISDPMLELTVPQKFQAYLSSGKPIFAIMKGDVKKMVEEYDLGLVSNPDDLQDIKEGYEKFATLSEDRIMDFGNNCKDLYLDKFQKIKNIQLISSFLFQEKIFYNSDF
jgi:glycosyltransferase involved in cell wall biosynthesis